VAALREGRFDFAVTERLLADQIAASEGWHVEWAPLPRYPLVIGLWKGDLTLKRAIVDALAQLERSGETAVILSHYLGMRRATIAPEQPQYENRRL
jgi:polar amino acid transport system substrate-binding protein/cystine transport system substrate-binding protein/membrane-bound lytic murein transglycosylase F